MNRREAVFAMHALGDALLVLYPRLRHLARCVGVLIGLIVTATAVTSTALAQQVHQIINFGTAPAIVVGGTGEVSATATSGLTVSFTTLTPDVCAVNGGLVTNIIAGTCLIAADQSGNDTISSAAPVTQSITIGSTLPPATILTLVPGWNLMGNSASASLTVATTFNDTTKVSTVWKWIPATNKWAFYTPSLADGEVAPFV